MIHPYARIFQKKWGLTIAKMLDIFVLLLAVFETGRILGVILIGQYQALITILFWAIVLIGSVLIWGRLCQ